MKQQVTNFGRFYTAIRAMNPVGDREEVKRSIVLQYTDGRTDSLREMTLAEYTRCCSDLERRTDGMDILRKERSATLHLMQRMGGDTSDWERVNALCRNSRIAGKDFRHISADEHPGLRRKLRGIERKGGLRSKPAGSPPLYEGRPQKQVTIIPMGTIGQA